MGSASFGIDENKLEDLISYEGLGKQVDDNEFHFLPSHTAKNYDLEELLF